MERRKRIEIIKALLRRAVPELKIVPIENDIGIYFMNYNNNLSYIKLDCFNEIKVVFYNIIDKLKRDNYNKIENISFSSENFEENLRFYLFTSGIIANTSEEIWDNVHILPTVNYDTSDLEKEIEKRNTVSNSLDLIKNDIRKLIPEDKNFTIIPMVYRSWSFDNYYNLIVFDEKDFCIGFLLDLSTNEYESWDNEKNFKFKIFKRNFFSALNEKSFIGLTGDTLNKSKKEKELIKKMAKFCYSILEHNRP